MKLSSHLILTIFDNIKDGNMLNKIKQIIHDSFYSGNDPIMELDDWICGSLKALDKNCNYKCQIEFTFEVPLTAFYNSEFIKDYYTTSIFLLCFIQIMLKIELISKEQVLDIIDKHML